MQTQKELLRNLEIIENVAKDDCLKTAAAQAMEIVRKVAEAFETINARYDYIEQSAPEGEEKVTMLRENFRALESVGAACRWEDDEVKL